MLSSLMSSVWSSCITGVGGFRLKWNFLSKFFCRVFLLLLWMYVIWFEKLMDMIFPLYGYFINFVQSNLLCALYWASTCSVTFSFIVGECVVFALHVCEVLQLNFDPEIMYFDRFFLSFSSSFPGKFRDSKQCFHILCTSWWTVILPFSATELM
jgi:hypothetical protein